MNAVVVEAVKIHTYKAEVADFYINTFLVETQNGVVAIDTAFAKSDVKNVRNIIDNIIKKPLLAVLVTHGHPDHFYGLGELTDGLNVPIYATQGTIDFAKIEAKRKDASAREMFGDDYPEKRVFPNNVVKHGDVLTFDDVSFELRDYGPGESDDDTIWVTEIDGIDHVFLGDIVYSHMHCFFKDLHAREWLQSLERLENEFDHTAVFHITHGETCGTEMIQWQKGYILAFINSVKSMYQGKDSLGENETNVLKAKMKNFNPNEKLLFLLEYELGETVKLFEEKGLV